MYALHGVIIYYGEKRVYLILQDLNF